MSKRRYAVQQTMATAMALSAGAATGMGAQTENVTVIICGCIVSALGMTAMCHTELERRESARFERDLDIMMDGVE